MLAGDGGCVDTIIEIKEMGKLHKYLMTALEFLLFAFIWYPTSSPKLTPVAFTSFTFGSNDCHCFLPNWECLQMSLSLYSHSSLHNILKSLQKTRGVFGMTISNHLRGRFGK
jgi:hypothetical protein